MTAHVTFTTRAGGVSDAPYAELNLGHHVGDDPASVGRNRARLAESLGVGRVVFMHQVHGRDIAVVDGGTPDVVEGVDVLMTTTPGLAIGVLVADCVPIALVADGGAAVVHAGRRGMQSDVVTAAVEALAAREAGPLRAFVGPAICGRCYEVPPDMQADVAAAVPVARCTTSRGTTGLDLKAGVVSQLQRAGVVDITVDPACTAEDARYFSHRRDGVTGRFAGVAILTG